MNCLSVVTVYASPEPVTAAIVPFVASKSAAVTDAARRSSLELNENAIEASLAGSAWPAACCSVTLGAFALQTLWLGNRRYTTVTGKGDSGLGLPAGTDVVLVADLLAVY